MYGVAVTQHVALWLELVLPYTCSLLVKSALDRSGDLLKPYEVGGTEANAVETEILAPAECTTSFDTRLHGQGQKEH